LRDTAPLQVAQQVYPSGAKLARWAIQLGLRGDALEAFSKRELLEVMDITEFMAKQRPQATSGGLAGLRIPVESVYVPSDPAVRKRLGLGSTSAESAAAAGAGRDASSS
jgi:hypothetical protein